MKLKPRTPVRYSAVRYGRVQRSGVRYARHAHCRVRHVAVTCLVGKVPTSLVGQSKNKKKDEADGGRSKNRRNGKKRKKNLISL